MSVTTPINRLITTSIAGLYQGLLASGLGLQDVANRLVKIAENAHAFRQYDRLHEIGEILSNFPLKQYQYIGQYYLALSMCRNGQANMTEVRPFIEKLATVAPIAYRARAIQLLAATYGAERNPEQELYFYLESLKIKVNTFMALRSIAVLKTKEGYHKQALKDLESLRSFARYMLPHIYFDYLNSLAVELWEAGRKYEARNIIKHVVASPFIQAYPEWQETARELKEPDRSFISVSRSVPQIERKHVEIETKLLPKSKKDIKPGNVLPFQKLKEAPPPEKPERVSPTDWDDMTGRQRRDLLMTGLRTGAISDRHYEGIALMTGMIKSGPASKVIDLEDETIMTDKLIEWAHMIDPDDLAGVISLLRDCDDKLRQVNLMDAMIRKLFEYSSACGASEEVWRKKVERRLPRNDS
jgi:hypothetical protein